MKKTVLSLLVLFSSVTLYAKEGYSNRITNKTGYPLKVSVLCTHVCDKNDKTCKAADGYMVIIPPHKTMSVKKDNMAYEIENPKHENALKLEIPSDHGQMKIPPKRITNPTKKKFTVTIDSRNMLAVK